jgi:hypothetical protein
MQQVERIIDAALPQSLDLVPAGRHPVTLNLFERPQISLNFTEQHIERLEGIVTREVHGNIELTRDERHFIEVIAKHGDSEARELTTSLYQLRDPGTSDAERVTAAQRLRTFLLHIGEGIEMTAFGVLQAYIEKKLGL